MSSPSLEDVAKRLVQSDSKAYLCIVVAGGGSHAIATLASTPGASSLLLEGILTYDRKSIHAYVGKEISEDIKYVSEELATLLSQAALRRAMQYRSNIKDYPYCIGVGMTSALVTSSKHREKGSFGHVCATLGDGTAWKCKMSLPANKKNRVEEDKIMGHLILQLIEHAQTRGASELESDNVDHVIQKSFEPIAPKDEVKAAAERILRGDTKAVLLLPKADNKSFLAVTEPVLPQKSLIFPGSFNPPHHGHTGLAEAAARAWKDDPAVFMELSLTNPDKPSMDPDVVSDRAHKFLKLVKSLPNHWGILLTSAPLFAEKVDILRPYMTAISLTGGPKLGFVIGTDTMVRILNPKYYGGEEEKMIGAVREMGRSGVHFVVGGRLEQVPGEKSPQFVSGEDELSSLPEDVRSMFTLVREDDFRVDVSSTEIRKQMDGENG